MSSRDAARVAVQFGRQPASRPYLVDEIARDASDLADLGNKIRRHLERQRPADALLKQAERIAAKYEAKAVPVYDLNGCVLALTFRGGTYSCGPRNYFFVA